MLSTAETVLYNASVLTAPFTRHSRFLQCPYVATHVVRRATTVAPPGIKLADITVLGKHLRPDLALGVSARPEAGSAAAADEAAAKAAAQFESTTSSGPSSSSDSAGSASEGEGVAGSSHRAPADAGDALGSSSASSPAPPASAPAGATRAFAVISLGGTQYKVTPGDIINAERIPGAEVGSTLTITAVHAVGTASTTVLGRPTVPGAAVRLTVEECCLDRKVIVFKKRRRKRYQRTAGHRRMVTRLRVEEVHADPSHFA